MVEVKDGGLKKGYQIGKTRPVSAETVNFWSTSNFDCKDLQYLIWKILFISVWKSQAQGCGTSFNMCYVA